MLVTLVSDGTVGIDFRAVAALINGCCKDLNCLVSSYELAFSRKLLRGDEELKRLEDEDKISITESNIFYVTRLPFDDNFFYHRRGSRAVLSMNGWEKLTDLPISNGTIYHICRCLLKHTLGVGVNHDNSTGCLNDYMWDKTIVNTGMRAAFHCSQCRRSTDDALLSSQVYKDIMTVLDAVAARSRGNEDILNESVGVGVGGRDRRYDAFLCHNSIDKPNVRRLNEDLVAAGIRTWFDEVELAPGEVWQQKLEDQIESIRCCLVIVGENGRGPWQEMELNGFISEFARRRCRIIPVIIGAAGDAPQLPVFLRQFMWADLREDSGEQLARLIGALRSPYQSSSSS